MKTILPILLCLWLLPCQAADPVRPPFLKAGDTIGIVAPAAKLPLKCDTAQIRSYFEHAGLHVIFGRYLFNDQPSVFAADDQLRAADMQAMLDDDRVRAVVAVRGGYGSVRLLDRLDMTALHRNPKWIAGYSDITTLHLALLKQGVESLHAAMPAEYHKDSVNGSLQSLLQALFGEVTKIELPPHPFNRQGRATGYLAGGNLSILQSVIGTPEDIDMSRPVILFIEEVGERAYKVDRMMQHLQRSGWLGNAKAIIIGHFTRISEADAFTATNDIYELIRSYTDPLGIPVVFGMPAGHANPNQALYMGRKTTIKVDDAGTQIVFN